MKSRNRNTSWIAGKDLLVGVGARDALEAKLIERAGFDLVWSSSLGVSTSHAVPDASLLSSNQFLDAARSMREAVDIPVLVDCDTGYGNENNVAYAVRQFEAAGIAGVCFEDKEFPKDNSLLPGGRQTLAPIEDFAIKISAALESRKSTKFVIVARVEALIAGMGLEEASRRAYRYAEAGADCIFIHSSARTPDEIVEFVNRWDLPVPFMLVPTNYPSLTEPKIRSLGKVKIVVYANQVFRAGVKAQERVLAQIKQDGGIHTIDSELVPVNHIFELQGVPEMKENEKEYRRLLGERTCKTIA